MKVEIWNGHAIRFVEQGGSWCAVAADICDALDIDNPSQAVQQIEKRLREAEICDVFSKYITLPISSDNPKARKTQKMLCVSETSLYELIFASRKKEAVSFRHWVVNLLKALREALGYEQYRIMAFAESAASQRISMDKIKEALNPTGKIPYIKAQTIANKCMANILGERKAIGKGELKERYPELIPLRDKVLDSAAELMALNEKYCLGLSVSKAVYEKYGAAALEQVQLVHG